MISINREFYCSLTINNRSTAPKEESHRRDGRSR